MKFKLLLITLIVTVSGVGVKAQSPSPNYLLAGQLTMIIKKIGLPVDSATGYLGDFTKVEKTSPTETVYKSNTDDVFISFEKGESGHTMLIKVFMPKAMLSTAEKAIGLMGMMASGTAAPPGYTAYATPKYAAFLNPALPNGSLSLVMVQGGK
jgi:hypothetical protein